MSSLTFSGQRESTLSLVLRLDPWGPRAPGKFIVPFKGGRGTYLSLRRPCLGEWRPPLA